jgi:hypothetical protein
MKFLVLFIIFIVIFVPIVCLWVKGFDFMDRFHSDYTGDDLFGLDNNDKDQIG